MVVGILEFSRDAVKFSSILVEFPANVILGESQGLDDEVVLAVCDETDVDAVLTSVHEELWELDDAVILAEEEEQDAEGKVEEELLVVDIDGILLLEEFDVGAGLEVETEEQVSLMDPIITFGAFL